jgi:hypothetical protein
MPVRGRRSAGRSFEGLEPPHSAQKSCSGVHSPWGLPGIVGCYSRLHNNGLTRKAHSILASVRALGHCLGGVHAIACAVLHLHLDLPWRLPIALAVVLAASGTALAQKSAGTLRVYNQQPAKRLDPGGSHACRGDVVHGGVRQFGFCSISTGRATGSSRRTPSPTIATLKWRSSSMRSCAKNWSVQSSASSPRTLPIQSYLTILPTRVGIRT